MCVHTPVRGQRGDITKGSSGMGNKSLKAFGFFLGKLFLPLTTPPVNLQVNNK